MDTQSAQTSNNDHYVDAYVPPSAASDQNAPQPPTPLQDISAPTPQTNPTPAPAAEQTSSVDANQSETLEDQNIFFLLGVRDGTDAQKESFLDELQQVIWEDFLEFDVKLLITSEEMVQLQSLLTSETDKDLEKQEKIVVYLEKLIPDLEEIMLEKALELKEEMVRERAEGLKQYYADKPEKIQRVTQAEEMMDAGKWYSAAHLMNSLLQA